MRPATVPGASNNGVLRFYTEEAPGLRIGPTTVLVLSLLFIASVVLMHMTSKIGSSLGSSDAEL